MGSKVRITQASIAWVEKELGKCPETEPPVGSLHYKPLNLGGKGESMEPHINLQQEELVGGR